MLLLQFINKCMYFRDRGKAAKKKKKKKRNQWPPKFTKKTTIKLKYFKFIFENYYLKRTTSLWVFFFFPQFSPKAEPLFFISINNLFGWRERSVEGEGWRLFYLVGKNLSGRKKNKRLCFLRCHSMQWKHRPSFIGRKNVKW